MARDNGKWKSVEERLEEYEYIPCRLRRHQWDEQGVYTTSHGRSVYVALRYKCRTCKMERTDVYNRLGDMDHRWYKPPKGYQIHYTPEERERGETLTTRRVAKFLVRRALKGGDIPELPE